MTAIDSWPIFGRRSAAGAYWQVLEGWRAWSAAAAAGEWP